ncbi:MAG TPA: hypothetical protein VGY31_09790 [Terriglobia bacterium]|nr:hypothetical protein [Terriglobia bacterium]
MKSHSREFIILAVVALVVAVLRFFMQGWVESAGISARTGSFFASIDIVLLVGLVIIFVREGIAAERRYTRAAAWFVLLTAWCTVLVIAGILTTATTGATTYYQDTMSKPPPAPSHHAMMHAIAFVPMAVIGLILGAIIYWVAGLARRGKPALAH